jgi:L-lactate dehydrogenase
VLSVSSLIQDYYGISDICFSLPTVVDRGGIESVLRLELSNEEADALRHSSQVLLANVRALELPEQAAP